MDAQDIPYSDYSDTESELDSFIADYQKSFQCFICKYIPDYEESSNLHLCFIEIGDIVRIKNKTWVKCSCCGRISHWRCLQDYVCAYQPSYPVKCHLCVFLMWWNVIVINCNINAMSLQFSSDDDLDTINSVSQLGASPVPHATSTPCSTPSCESEQQIRIVGLGIIRNPSTMWYTKQL